LAIAKISALSGWPCGDLKTFESRWSIAFDETLRHRVLRAHREEDRADDFAFLVFIVTEWTRPSASR